MKSLKHSVFILIMFMFLTASAHAGQKLVVYTVNYPLQYFAEQIGGDLVDVHFPAPAGVDPAFWMPDTEVIASYQAADLILLNGAGYAKWISKVSLPRMKMVNTSQPFMDDYITTNFAAAHTHGTGGDHSHAGMAFTTWLDFNQALMQARTILDAFKQHRPESVIQFEKNYAQLQRQIMDLERRMQAIRLKNPGLTLWASHPVYQYLARRYSINIQSVMWEPDEIPSKQALKDLKKGLKEYPSRWMIWEGQPRLEMVQALSTLQLQPLLFSPCANMPAEGDFMTVMQGNVDNLETALD